MKRITFISMIAIALCGCPHEKYSLKLSYANGKLNRRLTVRGIGRVADKEVIASIEKIYGSKPEVQSFKTEPEGEVVKDFTFEGEFKDSTPNDVGGSGSIAEITCPWGSAVSYIETFRGSDDAFGQIDARLRAMDKAVDLAMGWLRTELGEKDGFDKFEAFVEKTFRSDLKSIALYKWLWDNTSRESGDLLPAQEGEGAPPFDRAVGKYREIRQSGILMRMVQFAAARKYISQKDIMIFIQAEGVSMEKDQIIERAKPIARRVLVTKAGIKDPDELIDSFIELVNDEERTEKSFEAYLRTTAEFKEFEKKHKADEGDDVMDRYQEQLNVLDAINLELFATDDELSIEFKTGREPVSTNGKWDAEAKVVRWEGMISPRPEKDKRYLHLPDICHANWAIPNVAAQYKQFGKVPLKGEQLIDYVHWYNALPDAKRKKWDEFAEKLTKDNIDTLLDYKLEGESEPAPYKHDALGGLYEAVSGKELPKKENG